MNFVGVQDINVDILNIDAYNTRDSNIEVKGIDSLRSSIANNGILVPIIIDTGNNVIDGILRVKILRELNMPTVKAMVYSFDSEDEKLKYRINVNSNMNKISARELVSVFDTKGDTTREEIQKDLGISNYTWNNARSWWMHCKKENKVPSEINTLESSLLFKEHIQNMLSKRNDPSVIDFIETANTFNVGDLSRMYSELSKGIYVDFKYRSESTKKGLRSYKIWVERDKYKMFLLKCKRLRIDPQKYLNTAIDNLLNNDYKLEGNNNP